MHNLSNRQNRICISASEAWRSQQDLACRIHGLPHDLDCVILVIDEDFLPKKRQITWLIGAVDACELHGRACVICGVTGQWLMTIAGAELHHHARTYRSLDDYCQDLSLRS